MQEYYGKIAGKRPKNEIEFKPFKSKYLVNNKGQ